MGESKHTPLTDAEVAEAYEEEMKGPQGVSFALRDDHLLARAHRALMLEALRRTRDLLVGLADSEDRAGKHNAAVNVRALEAEVRAAIKAATGGER